MADENTLLRVSLNERGTYNHFYGHDEKLAGLDMSDERPRFPAQLVLSLDMNDPLLKGLNLDVGPVLRLVAPLAHLGGNSIAYWHINANEIEFEQPVPFQGLGDGTENLFANFPRAFKRLPVKLEIEEPPGDLNQRYGPDKQGREGYGPAIDGHSPYIWHYPEGKGIAIFLGSNQRTIQDYGDGIACSSCEATTRLLARIPSYEHILLTSWPTDVYLLFWYCPECKSITTHNEV